jgi:hypothetical protein
MNVLRAHTLLVLLLAAGMAHGQREKNDDKGWVGGLQYRPLIPTSITKREFAPVSEGGFTSTMEPRLGHSFGVLVRYNFNRHLALEFGLAQTRRNHVLEAASADSGWTETSDFGIVTYEIPLQALYYVRLSDQFYGNILAGPVFNFHPTDVESFGGQNELYQRSYRRQWVTLSLVLNAGVEYRTKKSGYFYVGASVHRPVKFIFSTFYYQYPTFQLLASSPLQGMYTALDFRYFLPKSGKEKRAERMRN